jgi:hypothetical protein
MKLRPADSTQPPISEMTQTWEHPWNSHMKKWDAEKELDKRLKKPKSPTKEAIEKAKFKDKTYHWKGQ